MNDEERITKMLRSSLYDYSNTSVLTSNLCDYSDAYIIVKGTITVINTAVQGEANNGADKKIIFKNCAPFTKCISRINNGSRWCSWHWYSMPIYDLIEYSDSYSNTSGSLWKYCIDEPDLNNDGKVYFTAANAITDSFKIKAKNIS